MFDQVIRGVGWSGFVLMYLLVWAWVKGLCNADVKMVFNEIPTVNFSHD